MERPFVYMNMAMTADGKITSAAREYPEFTSDVDRKTMDRLRAEADAVLVGAGTLRADDPPLHVRDREMREYRRSLGKPEGLLNIVVTAAARLDPGSTFFTSPHASGRIVATVDEAPEERTEPLGAHAEIWRLGSGRVDLGRLLESLHHRGVRRLLVEGGGELNWEFVHAGLLDELYVTVCPALLGGREAPTLLEGAGLSVSRRIALKLLDARTMGNEIFCRYAVVR